VERLARLRTAKRPPPRRNPRALAVTAVAALVVTGLIAFANAECLELVVASSNEKSQLLADIAKTYPAPQVDRRCVTVKIIEKASGAAERALRRDWADEGLRKPHVWSPAATTWLVLLAQHRSDDGHGDIVQGVAHSLMQSPLDIAMPESMANALPTPGKIGWQDIYDLARDPKGWGLYGKSWGPFRLGKTDPTTSTSGLHALISVNYAAQRTSDPDFVKIVESSVVTYGDTVRTLLRNLRVADGVNAARTYVSAIPVEEKQVFDYNNPPTGLPPKEKLKAIHPTDGTLVADHPYAILTWTDAAHKQAAADFEEYLSSPEIQARF
jgi:Ca-activated chloride channel family protein